MYVSACKLDGSSPYVQHHPRWENVLQNTFTEDGS